MKTETVEEFLARGGKITKCPHPSECESLETNKNIVFGKGITDGKKSSKKGRRNRKRKKAKS